MPRPTARRPLELLLSIRSLIFSARRVSGPYGWLQRRFKQLHYRAVWQSYFEQTDVFLMPVWFTVAMKHDHSQPMPKRQINTVDGKRSYMDLLPWMATATLTGCPASVAPIGRTAAGLPVGIQIMGPFWEDATPIQFAELLAAEIGGFVPPAGYQS